MTKPDPQPLFLTEADTTRGRARVVALQAPGTDRIAIGIEFDDGTELGVMLNADQCVGLATQLLAANLEELPRIAAKLDEQIAKQIAASLLAPSVALSLLRKAEDGGPEAS